MVNVKLVSDEGHTSEYVVNSDDCFDIVADKFCKEHDLDRNTTFFFANGVELAPEDTPQFFDEKRYGELYVGTKGRKWKCPGYNVVFIVESNGKKFYELRYFEPLPTYEAICSCANQFLPGGRAYLHVKDGPGVGLRLLYPTDSGLVDEQQLPMDSATGYPRRPIYVRCSNGPEHPHVETALGPIRVFT